VPAAGDPEEGGEAVVAMRAVIVAAAVAFVLTLFGTPIAIRILRSLRYGQPIRDVLPEGHQKKVGTPTMGGLVFIGATLIAYVAGHLVLKTLPAEQIVPPGPTITGLVLLGLMVCCGAIGFADDYLKVSRRNSAGLAGRWKILLQIVVGGAFGALALTAKSTAGITVSGTTLSYIRDIKLGTYRPDRRHRVVHRCRPGHHERCQPDRRVGRAGHRYDGRRVVRVH